MPVVWSSSSYIGTMRTIPVSFASSCIRFVVGPSGMCSVYEKYCGSWTWQK